LVTYQNPDLSELFAIKELLIAGKDGDEDAIHDAGFVLITTPLAQHIILLLYRVK
jgi:hypothetical protein